MPILSPVLQEIAPMKIRHSLFLLATAMAGLQLAETARAAAFVCKSEIVSRAGIQREVSGWIHANSTEQADKAWSDRVRGEHRPRSIESQRCQAVYGKSRR